MNRKALRYGITAAVLVLLSGFCMIFLLYSIWRQQNPESTLPGLFYYKAAAIGDPFCLPLLIGALCFHHAAQNESKPVFHRAGIIAGIIAFLTGAGIQAQWLFSDQTGLNWSLPQTHHFNLGGWYHALFFAVIFAALALLLTEYLRYTVTPPHAAVDFLIYFAAIFFCLLHFIDDYLSAAHPVLSLLTAAAVLTGFCALCKTVQHIRLHRFPAANYIALTVSGVLAFLLSLTQI